MPLRRHAGGAGVSGRAGTCRSGVQNLLFRAERLVRELLSLHRRLVHQSALCDREYCHTVAVGTVRDRILPATARARRCAARRVGADVRSGRDRDGADAEPALADRREDGVTVASPEESGTLRGIPEELDRSQVRVCGERVAGEE